MSNLDRVIDGLRKAAEEMARYAPTKVNVRCQAYFDMAVHALKEQEPVEPTLGQKEIDFRSEIVDAYQCGSCRYELDYGWQYCPMCGKAVKWDAETSA